MEAATENDSIQGSSKESNGGDENIPISSMGSFGGEVGEGENFKAVEMGKELEDKAEEEVVDEVGDESHVAGSSRDGDTGCGEFTPLNIGNGEVTTPNPSSTIPYVGLKFTNEDLAFQFYDEYAKMTGFGIRKQKVYRSRRRKVDGRGELLTRVYVCHKAGFKNQNDKRQRGKVVKQRPEFRVGCEALMRIKADPSGFIVDKFVESHNHELVPEDTFRLRSHLASDAVKVMVDELINTGLSPTQILDAVREALGGYHNMVDSVKNCGLNIPEDNYPSCSCGRGLMRPVLITVPGLPNQRQILVCPITSDQDKGVACSDLLPWDPTERHKHIHCDSDAKVDYLQTP